MALAITNPDPHAIQPHAIGDLFLALVTITFSGSYATGGDALDLGALFAPLNPTFSVIVVLGDVRGNDTEYDQVNKKLKLYSSANTELAAAAYNAALTAAPVTLVALCR
jgi:hypothetical protein